MLKYGPFLAVAIAACGDDDMSTPLLDAGPMSDAELADAGAADASERPERPVGLPELPVLVIGDGVDEADPSAPTNPMPANLSCLGERRSPVGGDSISFALRLTEFISGEPLAGVCVRHYANNQVELGGACDAARGGVTDDDGTLMVEAPAGGFFAYRIFPKESEPAIAGAVQRNVQAPMDADGMATGDGVSEATLDLIPSLVGFRQAAGTAVVAGRVSDCDDAALHGVVTRLYQEDGTPILEGTASLDTHYRYSNGAGLPSRTLEHTHVDGFYAVVNVPVAPEGEIIFVETWAVQEEGAEPELIGCAETPIFPDAAALADMPPLRSDAPACPFR